MEAEKKHVVACSPEMSFFVCFVFWELVLPVDIAKLVEGMNGLHQLSQIELSHGLIELILVSV